jgi:hypothetical protein
VTKDRNTRKLLKERISLGLTRRRPEYRLFYNIKKNQGEVFTISYTVKYYNLHNKTNISCRNIRGIESHAKCHALQWSGPLERPSSQLSKFPATSKVPGKSEVHSLENTFGFRQDAITGSTHLQTTWIRRRKKPRKVSSM